MPQNDDASFYQLYFQEPGVAEAELERDPREISLKTLFSGSGDVPRRKLRATRSTPAAGGRHGAARRRISHPDAEPAVLPAWLSDADLDFYAGNSRTPDFAAVSTGTATSIATGS